MVKERDVVCREADEESVRGTEENEKKRKEKAEAADRAMQVTRIREVKMTELAVFFWCGFEGSEREPALKERREADGSPCDGFVDVETESEPIFNFHFLFLSIWKNKREARPGDAIYIK